MTIRLDEENGGKVLVVHVSGKLSRADYAQFTPVFERLIGQHAKLRLLFDMTDFHGWSVGAAWEDLKLDFKYHADIERVAMIGDMQWQRAMAVLCKPFTSAEVRYFDQADAAAARQWVGAAPGSPVRPG